MSDDALHPDRPAGDGDLVDIGSTRDTELFRKLGADLGGLAVARGEAAQDEVEARRGLLDGPGEGVGGCKGVAAGHPPVGEQDAAVRPEGDRLAEDLLGHRRAHRDHGNPAAFGLPDPQGRFQCRATGGVHHPFRQIALKGTGLRVPGELGDHRHLLDANDHLDHGCYVLWASTARAMTMRWTSLVPS